MIFIYIFIDMKYYTYLLIDPTTNRPFYVGKGSNRRMFKHEKMVMSNKLPNNNQHLFNKIKKILSQGKKVKYKKCIKNVDETTAFLWETRIEKCLRKKGYDLCNIGSTGIFTRGHLGKKHSSETIEKLKAVARGRYSLDWYISRYGEDGPRKYNERIGLLKKSRKPYIPKKISEETRQKLRSSHIGHRHSEDTKRKMSESRRGKSRTITDSERDRLRSLRVGKTPWIAGKKHTQETIETLKSSHSKPFSLISPNGEVCEGVDLKEFCLKRDLKYTSMHLVLSGKRNSCYGWKVKT